MDSYIIQVQPRDELTVLIDKLIHTKAERIYLLVPDNSRIAETVLNFRLLKREADSLKKEIVVVSSSPRVQNLALKSQLQAHQETSELRESASIDVDEVKPSAKRPKLSDITAPLTPTTPAMDETEVIKKKIRPKKKKKLKAIEQAMTESSDEQDEKITNFWERRPSLNLPKVSQKSSVSIPRPKIPKLGLTLSNAMVLRAVLFALIIASSLIASLTFYFILPKSKIYIQPVVEKISIDLDVRGDANSSAVSDGGGRGATLPAQIFEKSLERSKSIETTGEEEIRAKATGTMRVHNSYSSSPQTLVKTTRFVSEGGKLFRTIKTIVVPGAEVSNGKIVPSSTTVEVIASEPGGEYNISPSTFSIPGFKGTPKYLAFYGESDSRMSGGEIGKVKVITEDDYRGLEKEVKNELETEIDHSLDILLPEGFFIPTGAKHTDVIEIDSSGNIGDRADELTITGSILTKTFAVREKDAEALLANDFEIRFSGKRGLQEGKEIVYQVSDKRFNEGTFNMKISLSQNAAIRIDTQEIIAGISGKSEDEVSSFLSSYPGIKEASVTFWPFWVDKIPEDISKIEIIIE